MDVVYKNSLSSTRKTQVPASNLSEWVLPHTSLLHHECSLSAKRRKPFSHGHSRAAIELWKANVPYKVIMEQLDMSKATWKRILSCTRAKPENPVPVRKPGSGRLGTAITYCRLSRGKGEICIDIY
jgi:hypothetical protein